MARKPLQETPKEYLQIRMDNKVHVYLGRIAHESPREFRSFSHVVETILLWLQCVQLESEGDELIRELVRIKALRVMYTSDFCSKPPRRRVHMTLDKTAVLFVSGLALSYPGAFGNRDDALEQAGAYACMYYERQPQYLLERLKEVRIA